MSREQSPTVVFIHDRTAAGEWRRGAVYFSYLSDFVINMRHGYDTTYDNTILHLKPEFVVVRGCLGMDLQSI